MPRSRQPASPFRCFNSSPEVIRLAVMMYVRFPLGALKGVALLSRTAGLIGHLQEESQRPIGFIMAQAADGAITYDGEPAAHA